MRAKEGGEGTHEFGSLLSSLTRRDVKVGDVARVDDVYEE